MGVWQTIDPKVLRRHPNAGFVAWLLAYAAVLAYYAPAHWPNFDNDGMAYWALAEHLLHGRLEFLNAYWSPLHAVLLAPFALLDLKPWYAGHVCLALEGLFALWMFWRVVQRTIPHLLPKWLLAPLAAVLVGTTSSWIVTPHVLNAGLVLWVVCLVLHPEYPQRRGLLWQLALACALAYWARAYNALALGGFLAAMHVGHVVLAGFRAAAARVHLRAVGYAWGGLGVAIGVWAGAVALRTGEFHPLGTAGPYNVALAHPWKGEHPYHRMGLQLPPNPWAVSMFEDILHYPDLPRIPTGSEVQWQEVVTVNASRVNYWLRHSGVLWALGFFAIGALGCATWSVRKRSMNTTPSTDTHSAPCVGLQVLWLGVFPVLYTMGHLFAFFEDRYVYPAVWLLVVGAVSITSTLLQRLSLRYWQRGAVAALLVGVLTVQLNTWPRFMLTTRARLYEPFHAAAEQLRAQQLPLQGARWSALSAQNGEAGIIMAFLTGGQYCNEPNPALADTLGQWRQFGIQYVAVQGPDSLPLPVLAQVNNLRVYAVR
jgi:hypothetical protein